MAAFETTRPLVYGHSFGSGFFSAVNTIYGMLASWNDARMTRNALSKLTDRELEDIGLNRADLDAML